MMDNDIIDKILEDEQERVDRFTEESRESFFQLNESIREEFRTTLNNIVSDELPQFHREVRNSFSSAGMEFLLPHLRNMGAGGVVGDVAQAALDRAVGGLLSRGNISLRDIANAAGRAIAPEISQVINQVINTPSATREFTSSPGQQAANSLAELERGNRNR